ncbi:hypothetical protein C8F01DRAFT_784542 [Mycena amicta]|nr:hypothetical protein C8F01DRAFT_784542 [Mycena amicta]
MVLCLFALQTALTEKNIKFVYMASGRLHTIVKNIPVSFWALSSLGCHLQHCRKKALNDGDDDETKDKDGINETLPAEGYLVAAIPECVVFKRVVDAVCAWTTGPTNLLRSKIARSPLVASVSILDLPRAPIRKISYPELIDHWMKTTKWSGAKLKKVTSATQHIRDKDLEQQKGASHCEAGLMASLLLPSNPDVSSVDEPRVVSRAFENFESAASHLHYLNPNIIFHIDPITIGVAKKCCPLCRILSDSLSQHYKLSIELPGQHSRYFTWVAPHWLPPHILQDIEARLLRVVTSMLMDGVGSRL